MNPPGRWKTALDPRIALVVLVALVVISLSAYASEPATVEGRVGDETTLGSIEGAKVTLAYRDNGTIAGTDVTDAEGRYLIQGQFHGWFLLTVSADGYETSTQEVFVPDIYQPSSVTVDPLLSPIAGPSPRPSPTPTPSHLLYTAIATLAAITSIVLYSKIKRENLLRHAVRKRIHDHVKEHPGAHYRAILDDLELSMGVLTYHLNRLERAEYIRSRQDGMYRRFFVTGRRTEVKFFLSAIQESIMATIRSNQGISQSGIADTIGVTRKVVNYHIKILDQAGLIYVEERGRATACYSRECGMAATP